MRKICLTVTQTHAHRLQQLVLPFYLALLPTKVHRVAPCPHEPLNVDSYKVVKRLHTPVLGLRWCHCKLFFRPWTDTWPHGLSLLIFLESIQSLRPDQRLQLVLRLWLGFGWGWARVWVQVEGGDKAGVWVWPVLSKVTDWTTVALRSTSFWPVSKHINQGRLAYWQNFGPPALSSIHHFTLLRVPVLCVRVSLKRGGTWISSQQISNVFCTQKVMLRGKKDLPEESWVCPTARRPWGRPRTKSLNWSGIALGSCQMS